jgi:hypothetical protein
LLLSTRPPSAAFSRYILTLPQRHATLLTRLRLNFSNLGATKHFLSLDSPKRLCEVCGVEETREHFLLECVGYRAERRKLFKEVKRVGGDSRGIRTSDLRFFSTHALLTPSFALYTLLVVFLPFSRLLSPRPRPKHP